MMRLLSYLCGVLLIANMAVLLWPQEARTAPHVYSAKEDFNPHFVRLNKEIEDKYFESKSVIVAEGNSQLVNLGDGDCFRLGPFMHKANYELAQAVLFNANVEYQKTTRASKESNVYRVYLGPYASQAEASDARVELKRRKILDHFARKEGDSQYIISLGIYTTEESANNAVQLFDGKLESVRLKQELVVLPDSYWLHFDVDNNGRIKRQLERMDWGEQSARLGRFQCQETAQESDV